MGPSHKQKILLVESNSELRESFLELLESFNYPNVSLAIDYSAALDLLSASCFDILILDLEHSDRCQCFITKIHATREKFPARIILMSRYSDCYREELVIKLNLEPRFLLEKPFPSMDLIDCLEP